MDGSPTEIISALNVDGFVSEYDDSISIDCDDMRNFYSIFDFVYECIYDENFWATMRLDSDYSTTLLDFTPYNEPTPDYCDLFCTESCDVNSVY